MFCKVYRCFTFQISVRYRPTTADQLYAQSLCQLGQILKTGDPFVLFVIPLRSFLSGTTRRSSYALLDVIPGHADMRKWPSNRFSPCVVCSDCPEHADSLTLHRPADRWMRFMGPIMKFGQDCWLPDVSSCVRYAMIFCLISRVFFVNKLLGKYWDQSLVEWRTSACRRFLLCVTPGRLPAGVGRRSML